MPEFSKLVDRIAGEGSAAWDIHFQAKQDKADGKDVIIMSVGDPDFATPAPIINAAVKALEAGETHYTPILGYQELRQAIARELELVSGADDYRVNAREIMVTAGTQNAIFAASLCLIAEGDEVIALDPMYVTYEATWRISGGTLVKVPTHRANGFRLNPAELKAAVTSRTKAIAFANPNNPTGVVMNRAELQAIADIAIAHDLWVIADEVYAAQTFEKPHLSIATLPGMKERTITTGSLSKSQAMTGWRVGWIAGPEELIHHCNNLGLAMLYGVPGFIQRAAITALTSARGEMAGMLETYRKRRDLVASLLEGLKGVDVLVPEAGMFVLLDVSGTGMGANEFAARLYEKTGVATLGAAPFGLPAEECIRLSFTASEAELEEGCRRIIEFVQNPELRKSA